MDFVVVVVVVVVVIVVVVVVIVVVFAVLLVAAGNANTLVKKCVYVSVCEGGGYAQVDTSADR